MRRLLGVLGALSVLVFSFVVTYVLGTVLQRTIGFRLDEEDEVSGIDSFEHAETAYDLVALGGSGFRPGSAPVPAGASSSREVPA